jgi:transposase
MSLEEMIESQEGREIKRAIAVKMSLQGLKTGDICEILGVSDSYVSKWKTIYQTQGAEALGLGYKGRPGYLSEAQRHEVIVSLKQQSSFKIEVLRDDLEQRYGVVFKSKQSYYDLLDEAGISWHKSEQINPRKEEEKVVLKREEIKKN